MQKDSCPINHALRCSEGSHDGVEERTVNSIVGLGYIKEDGGSSCFLCIEDVW